MGRDLLASRELAWRLMVRDISAQYRQSFLGIDWAFLPPIVMVAGFTLAKDANVINVAATDNFAIKLILLVALFLWFRVPVSWTVILAPVALIHLVLLGTF